MNNIGNLPVISVEKSIELLSKMYINSIKNE